MQSEVSMREERALQLHGSSGEKTILPRHYTLFKEKEKTIKRI